MLQDVLEGAIARGINRPTVIAVHLAILACIGSLVFLLYITITAYPSMWPHVAVLLVLAFGLQIGMLWLVDEVGTVDVATQRKELFGESDGQSGAPGSLQQPQAEQSKQDRKND